MPSKSRSSTGPLLALILAGVVVFGLGAAALLMGGGDAAVAPEQTALEPSSLGAASSAMGKAPLPDWVPTYPSGSQTNVVSHVVDGQPTGTIQYKTTNSHGAIIEYYRKKLTQKGFVLTAFTLLKNTGVIDAKSPDGGRKVIVMTEPAPEGAKASIVFTALDPDKSRPVPGGSLPKFAEFYPGATVLEQSSRVESGAIVGHFRLTTKVKNPEDLPAEIKAIVDFYEPKIKAAHYKITREEEPEFATIEAVSRQDEGPVDLYVVAEDGSIVITLKVGPKE